MWSERASWFVGIKHASDIDPDIGGTIYHLPMNGTVGDFLRFGNGQWEPYTMPGEPWFLGDFSDPPTKLEIDTAAGEPNAFPVGTIIRFKENTSGDVYIAVTDLVDWHYVKMSKAV